MSKLISCSVYVCIHYTYVHTTMHISAHKHTHSTLFVHTTAFLVSEKHTSLQPPTATCGRRKTRSFRVINRRTGCFSRRFKSGILCAGRCAPGKCCRGIYNPFVQDPFIFTMECPDNPTRPHNVEFFQPARCICKKCSKRHYYPQYFDREWQIVW